jgi:hypothetical protein
MSILTEILLLCDGGKNCPDSHPFNQDGAKDSKLVSTSSVRAIASADGWVKVGHRDFCPACAIRLGHSK